MTERKKTDAEAKAARRRARETAADRARIGTVVASSYRIDEVLGRGAIGAVFGGVHLRLERPIAIKFVDPTLVDDPEIRARFKREARIAAQIGSSHVVEVFDYGVADDGAPVLVMERLVGEDLHARILHEGTLPISRALRVAKQVCRALGAAHANGIVHRDLKPENVFLLVRDGEPEFVKVVDFGLSTFVQSDDTRLTRAGQSVGTPLYMAPEQAGAHQFDARVDVYSLGVLIFEMTTGRLPFEAQTLQQLLVALATGTPRSIRDYVPSLPVELDELVKRFTARDPNKRPKTAAAALAEIVALEESLADKHPSVNKRRLPTALDGLPGDLPGAFADEVSGHLDAMRRTGRLSTVDAEDDAAREAAGAANAHDTRASSNENTERMERRAMDDGGSEPRPSAPPRARERVSERPAARDGAPSSVRPPSRSNHPPRRRDVVEEDSGIFVGKRDAAGGTVQAAESPSRATIPPAGRALVDRVSRWALWAALAFFAVALALVVAKTMRG
jgi:serine/threonine-protein kinase